LAGRQRGYLLVPDSEKRFVADEKCFDPAFPRRRESCLDFGICGRCHE
jgi:hypothetical protein